MTANLTAVSLFAGVGGIDLALERAGVHVTAAVEINAAARGVIAEQRPDIALFDDVTKVTPDELRATGFVPERGILAGGFPCQDLSVAGRRAGLGGARSGLFWHIMRLADALRPRWLLLENVPGLLSSVCPCPGDESCKVNGRNDGDCGEWRSAKGERTWHAHVIHGATGGACRGGCIPTHGGAMGAVTGAVGERGYGFAYRVLDAQFFGVPQRRRRVFIVGHLGDAGRPVRVLLEPDSREGNPAAGHQAGARVAPTLEAGTNRTGGVRPPGTTVDTAETLVVAPTLTAREGKGPDSDATTTLIVSALTANGVGTCGADDNQGQAGHLIPHVYRKAQKAHDPDDCERWETDDLSVTLDAAGHGPRTAQLVVSPTLTASMGSNVGHPGDAGKDDIVLAVAEALSVRPLAIRGRDEGAQLEVGPEGGPYNALRAGDGGSSRQSLVAITVTGERAHALTSEGHDASEDGTGRGTPIIAFSHTAGIDQQASESITPTMKAGHDSMPAVYQQQGSNVGPMGTLRAGNGNEQGGVPFLEHETTVRRLTPRECERLQGFPDDWTAVSNGKRQADSPRYQQMGNAVAVPVVEWIAKRIVEASA